MDQFQPSLMQMKVTTGAYENQRQEATSLTGDSQRLLLYLYLSTKGPRGMLVNSDSELHK